jgi:hypothetical protein
MNLVKINWRPNSKELRKFGWTILAGFLILGGLVFFKNSNVAFWMWGVGIVIGGTGLTGMKIALPFYWVWMGIAFVMGNIMSRILLGVIFAFVLTPLAVLIRLIRRDRLNLQKSNKNSYWENVKPHRLGRQSYKNQF